VPVLDALSLGQSGKVGLLLPSIPTKTATRMARRGETGDNDGGDVGGARGRSGQIVFEEPTADLVRQSGSTSVCKVWFWY
jgi:hypothetical protein